MSRAGHDMDALLRTNADGNAFIRAGTGARGDLHNIHIYNVSAVIGDNTHLRFYIKDDSIRAQYRDEEAQQYVTVEAPSANRLILELTGTDKIPAIGERKTYNPVRRAHNIGGDQEGVVRDEHVIRQYGYAELEGVVGVVVPLPDPPDPLPVDYVEPDPLPPDQSNQEILVQFEVHGEYDDNA